MWPAKAHCTQRPRARKITVSQCIESEEARGELLEQAIKLKGMYETGVACGRAAEQVAAACPGPGPAALLSCTISWLRLSACLPKPVAITSRPHPRTPRSRLPLLPAAHSPLLLPQPPEHLPAPAPPSRRRPPGPHPAARTAGRSKTATSAPAAGERGPGSHPWLPACGHTAAAPPPAAPLARGSCSDGSSEASREVHSAGAHRRRASKPEHCAGAADRSTRGKTVSCLHTTHMIVIPFHGAPEPPCTTRQPNVHPLSTTAPTSCRHALPMRGRCCEPAQLGWQCAPCPPANNTYRREEEGQRCRCHGLAQSAWRCSTAALPHQWWNGGSPTSSSAGVSTCSHDASPANNATVTHREHCRRLERQPAARRRVRIRKAHAAGCR